LEDIFDRSEIPRAESKPFAWKRTDPIKGYQSANSKQEVSGKWLNRLEVPQAVVVEFRAAVIPYFRRELLLLAEGGLQN
jgi:hypothetical protein